MTRTFTLVCSLWWDVPHKNTIYFQFEIDETPKEVCIDCHKEDINEVIATVITYNESETILFYKTFKMNLVTTKKW